MAWTTLRDQTDYASFIAKTAAIVGLSSNHRLRWGPGPKTYPCLIASVVPEAVPGGDLHVYTAYVYPDDATDLLKLQATPAAAPVVKAPVAPVASPAPGAHGGTQDSFNRWVSAQMLTIGYYLVETGICKEEQFEDKLLEMIEKVDAWKKERTAELKEQLGRTGTTILESLGPDG